MIKNFNKIIVIILLSVIFVQETHPYPPLYLVTIPTSGTLPRGSYSMEGLLVNDGGIVSRLSVGISNNLTLGFSWGVQNLIGDKRPALTKDFPDYHFKYRVWNEDFTMPGIVFGFDSQGRGKFNRVEISSINENPFYRYSQKSFGYYISFSKNYKILGGDTGFHIGINKTLETEDGDKDFNLFFGIDKEFNRSISLMLEYDAMLNDNKNQYDYEDLSIGKGIGYLNAGLRWSVSENLLLELNFNDINRNQKISQTAHREFKILYSQKF
tara:strand:+ start:6398 stop:7201 length:804 start_codon:yes stop_codon:yes gene_type:complete